jgi:signal transduction histidine kinase
MTPSLHESDRDRLLLRIIHLLIGLALIIIGLSLIDPANELRMTLMLYVPFVLLLLGLRGAVRRGHVLAVSRGITVFITAFVAMSVLLMGGLNGHSGTAFSVCVMLAGALLGGRAAIQTAAGVILFCTMVLWMQVGGRLPEPIFINTPINSWISLCMSLAMIAVLFQYTLLSLRSAITAAEQNARERDEAMQRFLTTQKMEVIGQLTSGVAHDFNNLLTVVSGSVSILEEELPRSSVAARELLSDIDAAAARASQMIRHLLSFSRTGHAGSLEPIDAARVLHELSPMLPRLLGAPIEVQLRAPAPAHILASRSGLEQILLNLAVNAREAMPDGGILTLSAESIEDLKVVRLVVEDTGGGMSAEIRERIFEPFFTTRESGTGLGLATVSALLKQFGGTVQVESTSGAGTRFTLTFPRSIQAPSAEPTPEPVEERGSSRRLQVLLVDDNLLVRRATERMLRSVSFDVTAVSDGQEALNLLSDSDHFDVIIADLSMPRVGGVAMAEELARRGSSTAMVFVSGNTSPDLSRSLPFPTSFLTKPFTTESLVAAISALTT